MAGILLSILAGLATLMALTGTLAPGPTRQATLSIRSPNIVLASIAQIVLFSVALIFTVAAGMLALL